MKRARGEAAGKSCLVLADIQRLACHLNRDFYPLTGRLASAIGELFPYAGQHKEKHP
jgi:hypothetical protein